ncbi:M50 family metallopeptidase [Actinomadura miaoliensis]|uniref:Peptidase M41 domain-containing protein n=1 Tax=Actinomadura miaoliensis TaxID=430685 RepID=A0ABP7WWM0_9ACTN
MTLRQSALHEAAHAVVARHYGLAVVEIVVSDRGNGHTLREDGGPMHVQAAITAAGEVGQRLAGEAFVDLSCDDLASFETRFGFGALWRAQQDARQVLTTRRAAWLALAARLERERVIVVR